MQQMQQAATSQFAAMTTEISVLKVDFQQQIDDLKHTNRVLVRSASSAWRASVANTAIDDIFKKHSAELLLAFEGVPDAKAKINTCQLICTHRLSV